MSVYNEPRSLIDDNVLHPTNFIQRAFECSLLCFRVNAPILRVGQQLLGIFHAGADDPVTPFCFLLLTHCAWGTPPIETCGCMRATQRTVSGRNVGRIQFPLPYTTACRVLAPYRILTTFWLLLLLPA